MILVCCIQFHPLSKAIKLRHFNQVSLLINMHEYFSGQVCFHSHPACDAMFHLKRSSSTSPFHMKIVEENTTFLEYTTPKSIVQSSSLPFYSTEKTFVYVPKKQLEVVDYITKFTG